MKSEVKREVPERDDPRGEGVDFTARDYRHKEAWKKQDNSRPKAIGKSNHERAKSGENQCYEQCKEQSSSIHVPHQNQFSSSEVFRS